MNKSKMLACLEYLGIQPSMESFDDRKRMQKITYLLPIFGVDIGLDMNSYSWYLHGPYSPELTETLFDIVEDPQKITISKLTKEDVIRIDKLKNLLGKDIESVDLLEFLVSLHFLMWKAKDYGLEIDEVVDILKEKKPYFTDNEIKYALGKIQMIL